MKNKKLNYRKGKNIKTLDGQKINKSNVISFVDSIFTAKEKKRLIELAKWSKNLDKDTDQYNNDDCNNWIEIWSNHLKAGIITKQKFLDNCKEIEEVRKENNHKNHWDDLNGSIHKLISL